MPYVALYVAAVVAANLSVAAFGPPSVYINAFLFIGLTLTTRDRLHEYWNGRGLALKMGAVIGTGAAISWVINQHAGQIAFASVLAFAAAESVDATVYHGLRDRAWLVKANASNVLGAAVDSLVFPTVAFGALLPMVVAGQFTAKVLGGLVWALVLRRSLARSGTIRSPGIAADGAA